MDFLELLWAYILVFLLSAVPFLEAIVIIPVAILAGLSTIPVLLLGLAGNILTVLIVIIFVEKIKEWRRKRQGGVETSETGKRAVRAKKLWIKYGLSGLAIIGPFFVGSHVTAFMSLIFGGTKKRVFWWITANLVFWCTLFAVLAHFGVDFYTGDSRFFDS